jgi:hypothetical protein
MKNIFSHSLLPLQDATVLGVKVEKAKLNIQLLALKKVEVSLIHKRKTLCIDILSIYLSFLKSSTTDKEVIRIEEKKYFFQNGETDNAM